MVCCVFMYVYVRGSCAYVCMCAMQYTRKCIYGAA